MKNPYSDCTVLVVDDQEDVRDIVGMHLESAGFCVIRAESGNVAIKAFDSGFIDVVVTDVHMSDGNGIALIDWIQKYHPECRVFLMTGNVLFDHANDLPGIQVFIKPFNQHRLVDAIAKACLKSA